MTYFNNTIAVSDKPTAINFGIAFRLDIYVDAFQTRDDVDHAVFFERVEDVFTVTAGTQDTDDLHVGQVMGR